MLKGVARVAQLLKGALPQHCALCAAASGRVLLCDGCAADLPVIGSACPVCAFPSAQGALCGECMRTPRADAG
jgi:predicted amidophosphoribosyltransferase